MALTIAVVGVTGAAGGGWRSSGTTLAQTPRVPVFGYEVVRTYPHDRNAFTQGLQFHNGALFEGTGLNGRSSVRRVRLETGEVLQRRNIPAKYFGEGIAIVGQELFQLTWQENTAFVYDLTTLALKRSHSYRGEGWGLAYDGRSLIMSDGTDQLRFLDPATFSERRRIRVSANGMPLRHLNELETIKGEVWANVWQTERVARIDPATGRVNGWIDLSGLLTSGERAGIDVLNGIAHDATGDRIFVTGKLWPKLFEIRVVAR